MHIDVARRARRATVLIGVSAVVALSLTASSGWPSAGTDASDASIDGFAGVRLENIARGAGLDFRQGAFRFGVSPDPDALTGGGMCELEYNNDGWDGMFVSNLYSMAGDDML